MLHLTVTTLVTQRYWWILPPETFSCSVGRVSTYFVLKVWAATQIKFSTISDRL